MIQKNYYKTSLIRTAPHVSPAMFSADYWMPENTDPDAVILSPDHISRRNRKILEKLSPGSSPLDVRYGICCRESAILYTPTRKMQTDDGDPYSDENRFSGILVNEPVWILDTSPDGQWFHIRTCYGNGWVLSEAVAVCRNRREWLEAQPGRGIPLVVTASRLTLQAERTEPEKEPVSYSMGTLLRPIPAEQAPKTVDDRFYFDNYVVKIPARNQDGLLIWEYRLIPVSSDVQTGYLPYTSRNVLRQIFKIQGNVYGWGDMYHSHDCSSYAMAVYRCFGFRLARNSHEQVKMPFPSVNLRNMTIPEKMSVLDHALPGSILGFDGHIVLYLGHEKNMYYGISAAGRCIPRKNRSPVSVGTAFVCELGSTLRLNGKSWISEFHTLMELK